jgi:hypothetical protein
MVSQILHQEFCERALVSYFVSEICKRMLFKTKFLTLIQTGKIETAFRKWTRPTVKENGTLITAVGQLRINAVSKISYQNITDKEIIEAGYSDRQELDAELSHKSTGEIYKITFTLVGEDPCIKLRENSNITPDEVAVLQKKLQSVEARSNVKGWPLRILEAVNNEPGLYAIQYANKLRYEKMWFKVHIRKLKNLGLTISLENGYKISPRGKAFLETVK